MSTQVSSFANLFVISIGYRLYVIITDKYQVSFFEDIYILVMLFIRFFSARMASIHLSRLQMTHEIFKILKSKNYAIEI